MSSYGHNINITLDANFTDQSISGTVDDHSSYASLITLHPAPITTNRGMMEFSGTASRTVTDPYSNPPIGPSQTNGSYQGIFMGEHAEQIAGSIVLPAPFPGSYIPEKGVFTAEKQ